MIDESTGEPVSETWALGRWHFGRVNADGTTVSVQSEETAVLGTEVQLTGAYDAQAQTISLFLVDRQGVPTTFTAQAGTGGLAVGKGWTGTDWGSRLPGRITQLRAVGGRHPQRPAEDRGRRRLSLRHSASGPGSPPTVHPAGSRARIHRRGKHTVTRPSLAGRARSLPLLGALVLSLAAPGPVPAAAADIPGAPASADTRVSRVSPVVGQGAHQARARVAREKRANLDLVESAEAERRAAWPPPAPSRIPSDPVRTDGSSMSAAAVSGSRAGSRRPPPTPRRRRRAWRPSPSSTSGPRPAGVTGVLFTVDGGRPGRAGVTVDYSSFASAIGGNWSGRLGLVRLPDCALTTPDKAACRVPVALPSTNDPVRQKVSADTVLTARSAPMVMAVTATSGGESATGGGDMTATPLTPSATWEAGASSGSFAWNYPLTLPPSPAGPVHR